MVGVRSGPRSIGLAVSAARIQHFAAMVRDANPAYWDAEFADQVWGGLVAPPALLMGLLIPPPWLPTTTPRVASVAIRVPLPGTTFINAANDAEFFMPIVEGDWLSVVEEVVSVSPEKSTRLGRGHFVETCESFYRQGDEPLARRADDADEPLARRADDADEPLARRAEHLAVVATNRNTLFRFTPAAS
ncbi:MAG: MaoC family dehydratase N-terminal domain-containing protein [Mycobacteriaceae bacterium]|nr:MaoC family dehydratase N-terminal domain-containing protein [Mycobacteriaceae bacterium]